MAKLWDVINTAPDAGNGGAVLFQAHKECAVDYIDAMSAADRPLKKRVSQTGVTVCHICEGEPED